MELSVIYLLITAVNIRKTTVFPKTQILDRSCCLIWNAFKKVGV